MIEQKDQSPSSSGSLRLRLLAISAITITLALVVAGFVLVALFKQEVTNRLDTELDHDLLQLAGSLQATPSGTIRIDRPLADSRFNQPLGGRYWAITEKDPLTGEIVEVLRSRSYWDNKFNPQAPDIDPDGETLVARHRTVSYRVGQVDRSLTLIVAAHDEEISSPVNHFRNRLALYLTLIGLALIVASWLQVSIGLAPLKKLQTQLAQLSRHEAPRLHGQFPSEVAPLVDGFNNVLEMRDQSLARARARAGDLAHGLMTPLTVLSAIGRDLQKNNQTEEAQDIAVQVDTMRAHVERHLARARLSTGRGHDLTPLAAAVNAVVSTIKRLPRGQDIVWQNDVNPAAIVPMERQDLLELLGNLFDNARKYAKSRVVVSYADRNLTIADDGPGVPEAALSEISTRGRRLDESRQGFGLGLAIVADVADLYGLQLSYSRSSLGGLQVSLRNPV